jgi:hypothetical protein
MPINDPIIGGLRDPIFDSRFPSGSDWLGRGRRDNTRQRKFVKRELGNNMKFRVGPGHLINDVVRESARNDTNGYPKPGLCTVKQTYGYRNEKPFIGGGKTNHFRGIPLPTIK